MEKLHNSLDEEDIEGDEFEEDKDSDEPHEDAMTPSYFCDCDCPITVGEQAKRNCGVCTSLIAMQGHGSKTCDPYIEIIEEPKQRGFRFRYGCEGPSHGGLPGVSSEKNKKTYPTVKIHNYTGPAKIVVQLVTIDEPPLLHVHSLVGRQCENGICVIQMDSEDMTASFPNLGILHVPKKDVVAIIEEQLIKSWTSDAQNGNVPLSDGNRENEMELQRKQLQKEDRERIHQEAQKQTKYMDLSVVRLMFTPYLPGSDGKFTRRLSSVISDPIYDSKAPNASSLRIVRMAKTAGSVMGGDEVFLLCDKVQKDDIQVRFYQEDESGHIWEAFGKFGAADVHRQFAIVFKTPKYFDIHIAKPVSVFVQLRRRSDGETSQPKPFIYYPHTKKMTVLKRPEFFKAPSYSDKDDNTTALQFPVDNDILAYFPTAELQGYAEVKKPLAIYNHMNNSVFEMTHDKEGSEGEDDDTDQSEGIVLVSRCFSLWSGLFQEWDEDNNLSYKLCLCESDQGNQKQMYAPSNLVAECQEDPGLQEGLTAHQKTIKLAEGQQQQFLFTATVTRVPLVENLVEKWINRGEQGGGGATDCRLQLRPVQRKTQLWNERKGAGRGGCSMSTSNGPAANSNAALAALGRLPPKDVEAVMDSVAGSPPLRDEEPEGPPLTPEDHTDQNASASQPFSQAGTRADTNTSVGTRLPATISVHIALIARRVDGVQTLLKTGNDPVALDHHGNPSLHML
ncbi:uncharacterized protein LOC144685340 [Cetorhinus maximus]